jgi:catechol 2,3-dioxygenase-like lactoylglutathione lyase family enzyme
MAILFNHTIVWSRDNEVSARYVADLLGLDAPESFRRFQVVQLDNDLSLDFASTGDEIAGQHYAFLVSEPEFDEIFARIVDGGGKYWADPGRRREGEINTNDGGRGVYFPDPDGHLLEILTRPYGSGG